MPNWAVMYTIKGPDEIHDFVYADIFAINCDLQYVNSPYVWDDEKDQIVHEKPAPKLTRKEIEQALNEWWENKHAEDTDQTD